MIGQCSHKFLLVREPGVRDGQAEVHPFLRSLLSNIKVCSPGLILSRMPGSSLGTREMWKGLKLDLIGRTHQ